MTALRLLALLVAVDAVGCTIVSRAVPCDDPGDCPAPLTCDLAAGRCVEGTTGEGEGEGEPDCGNGIVEAGEVCDDGDLDNENACTVLCAPPTCGDGIVTGFEICDEGPENADTGTACPTICQRVLNIVREGCDGLVQIDGDVVGDGAVVPDDAFVVETLPDPGCLGSTASCGARLCATFEPDATPELFSIDASTVRVRDAAVGADGAILLAGDRDQAVLDALPPPAVTDGFILIRSEAETLAGIDVEMTSGTSAVSRVASDGAIIIAAGAFSGVGFVEDGACSLSGAGAFIARPGDETCTGLVTFPGTAVAVTALAPIADGVAVALRAESDVIIDGESRTAGTWIVRVTGSGVDPMPLADVEVQALATAGDALIVAGRADAAGASICGASVAPHAPFVARFSGQDCSGSPVALDLSTPQGPSTVEAVVVHDDRLFVAGSFAGVLQASASLFSSSGRDGFLADVQVGGSDLELSSMLSVGGSGDQIVVDVVSEERGVAALIDSDNDDVRVAANDEADAGVSVLFLSPALAFQRIGAIGNAESADGVALLRGTGSVVHAVGQNPDGPFIATFGQP